MNNRSEKKKPVRMKKLTLAELKKAKGGAAKVTSCSGLSGPAEENSQKSRHDIY